MPLTTIDAIALAVAETMKMLQTPEGQKLMAKWAENGEKFEAGAEKLGAVLKGLFGQ